jgi:hypothetical protein
LSYLNFQLELCKKKHKISEELNFTQGTIVQQMVVNWQLSVGESFHYV